VVVVTKFLWIQQGKQTKENVTKHTSLRLE
jgi:hypothetical protein